MRPSSKGTTRRDCISRPHLQQWAPFVQDKIPRNKGPDVNSDVRQALAYCRQLTRRQAKNFYFAFLFLPSDKRAAVYSVYAFCRHSDDIADNPAPLQYKRDQLKHWRDELESCYNGNPTGLITLALRHTIRKYPIPQRYFEELLRGVEMDLTVQRYASFDDLKLYCYRVASAVGLACLEIFGYRHNGVRTYARNLGIAPSAYQYPAGRPRGRRGADAFISRRKTCLPTV